MSRTCPARLPASTAGATPSVDLRYTGGPHPRPECARPRAQQRGTLTRLDVLHAPSTADIAAPGDGRTPLTTRFPALRRQPTVTLVKRPLRLRPAQRLLFKVRPPALHVQRLKVAPRPFLQIAENHPRRMTPPTATISPAWRPKIAQRLNAGNALPQSVPSPITDGRRSWIWRRTLLVCGSSTYLRCSSIEPVPGYSLPLFGRRHGPPI